MLVSPDRFEEPKIAGKLREIRDRLVIKGDRQKQGKGRRENPRESLTHIDLISLRFKSFLLWISFVILDLVSLIVFSLIHQ